MADPMLPRLTSMHTGRPCWPPAGWRNLITREPKLRAIEPAVIKWTAERKWQLIDAAASWKRRLIYSPDLVQHQLKDWWALPDRYGDCEDYALAVRNTLTQAVYGTWPLGALRLVTCLTDLRRGKRQAHAVLCAVTDAGDWIIDPRRPGIWPWANVPYQWGARECPGRFMWEKLINN